MDAGVKVGLLLINKAATTSPIGPLPSKVTKPRGLTDMVGNHLDKMKDLVEHIALKILEAYQYLPKKNQEH